MLSDNTIIELQPEEVISLAIDQNFYANYKDTVTIDLEVLLETYKLFVQNRQDLRFIITINGSDSGGIIRNKHIATLKYYAIIKEQEDPFIKSPEGTLDNKDADNGGVSKTLKISIELIPEYIYKIRKFKFNFILNKATMEDTIMFVASLLGFKEVYIVPPDNTTVYDNVVIPPLLDISNIFLYLQEAAGYGVYNKGINYYISNGILYVFPMYTYDVNGPQFNIYSVGEGAYGGATNYHMETTYGVEVVNNTGLNVVHKTQSNVENVGNSYIVNTPHKYIDECGKLYIDNVFIANEKFITNITLYDNISGISKESFTQRYVTTDNLFDVTSALYTNLIFNAAFRWPFALPFVVKPNSGVNLLFDSDKQSKKYSGWCSSISYTFTKVKTSNPKSFACSALVGIGLLTTK
jgi:hypothetical protein